MADFETTFIPHNDMSPDDIPLVKEHDNLIKQNKYEEATALLRDANYNKGFVASLFNAIELKLQKIEIDYLNKFVAELDELYSLTEPTDEEMKEKTYWIQPY